MSLFELVVPAAVAVVVPVALVVDRRSVRVSFENALKNGMITKLFKLKPANDFLNISYYIT